MSNLRRVWWCLMAACAWSGCSADGDSGSVMDASGVVAATNDGSSLPKGDGSTSSAAVEAGAQDAGGTAAGDSDAAAGGAVRGDAAPPANDAGAPDGQAGPVPPFEGEGEPWVEAAPKATCGSADKPETVQGQGGDVSCNLIVHGQVAAELFLMQAWYGDCSYVNGPTGTTVIDVSDSAQPRVATMLTTPGMQSNWESMKVNEQSRLLVGYQALGPLLDVYDISECRDPKLQSSFELGDLGHAGQFSPDGTIYYATSFLSNTYAVDLMDPTRPQLITSDFSGAFAHDPFISKQGNRAYFPAGGSPPLGMGTGSIVIVDTSQVQARAADAKGTIIHTLTWEDGSVSQYPIALTYRGRDYLMITDELGSGTCDDPKKPPYGYGHMFDITDEKNPRLASKIKTEALGPCTGTPFGDGFFGVGTHYCNVDRRDDPRLLACGFFAAGVRVFDIRNPWRPKEIAYFDTQDGSVPGLIRIRATEQELWVAMQPGTFYVLRFAEGLLDDILRD